MKVGDPTWQPVLDYWFGGITDDAECANEKASLWWEKSAETDAGIRQRFEPLLQLLVNGGNRYWLQFPEGRLGSIIMLDQFPRNIYRETAMAFMSDQLALNWCLSGIKEGLDKALRPIERVFFYMPMEHAENNEVQHQSIKQFQQLAEEASAHQREIFSGFLDFAEQHAAVIEKFGRFPHRNNVLGRVSTKDELTYLAQPGSGF